MLVMDLDMLPTRIMGQSCNQASRRTHLGGSHGMACRVKYMKGKVMAKGDKTATTWKARNRPRRNRLSRCSNPPCSGNASCSVLTHSTRGRRRVCCCCLLNRASSTESSIRERRVSSLRLLSTKMLPLHVKVALTEVLHSPVDQGVEIRSSKPCSHVRQPQTRQTSSWPWLEDKTASNISAAPRIGETHASCIHSSQNLSK